MNAKITPSKEARAEAMRNPGGHVYVIDGQFGPDEGVPAEAIAGAWQVDDFGRIVGEFIPNPHYRPRQNASRCTGKDGE